MNTPTGTVTFLFTDIEGSTKLSQEFPDTIQSLLEKHNNILNSAVESNNGFVFKIIGDAFCCAFDKAEDAVKAAVEAQTALGSINWEGADIKVRMGIHSGAAEWTDNNYSGYVTLARSQRVMSTAYGGQIIASNNTFKLISEKTEDPAYDFSFRDLGERRLKDLIQPIRLFQIINDGLRKEFPPVKTIDARPNNIPVQLTSFIGREKEMKEIKDLLAGTRLLTLVGPGGTGKTRLSLQTGADLIDNFENGVWFVEIASLQDPQLLPQTIAQTLGLKEQSGKKTEDAIADFLKDKKILIIIDNCEHLIDASANIALMMLRKSPGLKIIATSREALHCEGEQTYKVQSLSHHKPGGSITPEILSQYEAVRLFIERATAVNPSFRVNNENAPALAQICFQLDGIPLAIELAAVRIKVLSLNSICERLDDRFKLLTGGNRTSLPRQQTLKALIDWSYDLLSEKEKLLLQRLSVFNGGWTMDASEKICSDEIIDEYEILDLLSNLADKSLIKIIESENNIRYTMLETIKKYSIDKLSESDSINEIHKKYFDYFCGIAEESETKLTGAAQREWISLMADDIENFRACLRWSFENYPVGSLKLTVHLGKFWELRSHFTEALEFLRKSLEHSGSADVLWKAKAVYWTGFFLIHQGKYEESKKNLNRSLEMFREINYKDGEAVSLISLGTIGVFQGDYENLFTFSGESLSISREINNRSYIARNLQNIGLGLMQQGDHDAARKKLEEGIKLYRELGDPIQLAKIIGNIGALEYLQTNYDKAREALNESLQLRYELGDRQGISIALNNLGSIAYMLKEFDEAERLLEESLVIIRDLGDKRVYVTAVSTLGSIANDKGDLDKAKKMFVESITVSNEIGDKYSLSKGFEGFADIYLTQNNYKASCILAAKYISLLESSKKNIIEGEIVRIENIKSALRSNLSDTDYETYWKKGESMTAEEVMKFIDEVELDYRK
ncbi:MAG TPA: tetratricopeptide repeat protein [Ignavibacteria bacterium]|nr:adenylate/guanylate cyclase domain-containing protein [Bacteroidota bacterium]HRI84256.1 tetratricopeptide repeat protein [Ignavibacteria bacterium]HRJ98597.1 tetratricopeptide repeat protein [Ignavibacteria bacterium]